MIGNAQDIEKSSFSNMINEIININLDNVIYEGKGDKYEEVYLMRFFYDKKFEA